eukprot:SAG31_NODE_13220_length_885_cov_0.657761_1_plen_52_part_01
MIASVAVRAAWLHSTDLVVPFLFEVRVQQEVCELCLAALHRKFCREAIANLR